jgi:hypothetical protein
MTESKMEESSKGSEPSKPELRKALKYVLLFLLLGLIAYLLLNIPKKTGADIPVEIEPPMQTGREACEAGGGKWVVSAIHVQGFCNNRTHDAGRACSDASECEGTCAANLTLKETIAAMNESKIVEGRCSEWRISDGCNAIVREGKVRGMLCVD